jgi:hypothetical protein
MFSFSENPYASGIVEGWILHHFSLWRLTGFERTTVLEIRVRCSHQLLRLVSMLGRTSGNSSLVEVER